VFWNASFNGPTFFDGTTFAGPVFRYGASYESQVFTAGVEFADAKFLSSANFVATTFCEGGNFRRVLFNGKVSFVNVDMRGPTSFERARFGSEPPQFFGARLHEGTIWRDVRWPSIPGNSDQAGVFVDAYERLKLEMNRLNKHVDELDFFAMEMRCRRVLEGNWHPVPEIFLFGSRIAVAPLRVPILSVKSRAPGQQRWKAAIPILAVQSRTIALRRPAFGLAIAVYGLLSDYGRSYLRPLVGLVATTVVGAIPIWGHLGLTRFWQAVGLSLAGTFGPFGFRKEFFASALLDQLPGPLKLLAATQTVVGVILLFLLGLAVRNRFRIK
jgi:hypothetical protein